MEFKEKDFDNCLANPLKAQKIKEQFPKLNNFEEFKKVSDKELRYIVAAYDKYSPLQEIQDLKQKKQEAVLLAGYNLNKNKFPEDILKIMNCQNVITNNAIIRYTTFHYDPEYEDLITFRELRVLDRKKMINNTDDATKKESIENLERYRNQIEALQLKILNKEKSISIMKQMMSFVEDSEMPTPEYIAAKAFDGIDVTKEWDE